MRVILLSDVKKQGKKDDIIEVKDGYANYLINNNLAVAETKTSKKKLDDKILLKHLEDKDELERCKDLKKQIEKLTLVFKVKVGEGDKVFGSISTKQIKDKLKEEGILVDKRKIVLDVPINTLGVTNVKIMLHKEVCAILKVKLTR